MNKGTSEVHLRLHHALFLGLRQGATYQAENLRRGAAHLLFATASTHAPRPLQTIHPIVNISFIGALLQSVSFSDNLTYLPRFL